MNQLINSLEILNLMLPKRGGFSLNVSCRQETLGRTSYRMPLTAMWPCCWRGMGVGRSGRSEKTVKLSDSYFTLMSLTTYQYYFIYTHKITCIHVYIWFIYIYICITMHPNSTQHEQWYREKVSLKRKRNIVFNTSNGFHFGFQGFVYLCIDLGACVSWYGCAFLKCIGSLPKMIHFDCGKLLALWFWDMGVSKN